MCNHKYTSNNNKFREFGKKQAARHFYFLLYTQEESIGFVKIFDFRFLIDLHVLRCPEHDLTIFRKCLSVCLYYFVDAVSQELMDGN